MIEPTNFAVLPDGYGDTLVLTETLDEIMTDKLESIWQQLPEIIHGEGFKSEMARFLPSCLKYGQKRSKRVLFGGATGKGTA